MRRYYCNFCTYYNISCPYIKVVLCVMAYLLYPRKAVPTGMIAGAGGQFLASPMDRVKIILQIEGASSSTSSLPRLVKGATLPPVAPSDVLRQDQRNMENSERYSEERRRERSVEGMGSQLPESCSRLPRRWVT